MKIYYVLIICLPLLVISCGPNQKEINERNVFVADSLKVVKEDSLAKIAKQIEIKERGLFIADSLKQIVEQKEKERIHFERIEVGKSIKKTKLTEEVNNLKSRLSREKRELNRIKQFQLGRSKSTKRNQINRQNKQIIKLEGYIKKIRKEISMINLYMSYDFQSTPSGTIKHVFSAAKTGDYSKMRHLLDPYGENDGDAMQICLIENRPKEIQSEFRKSFENGRIMSTPKINDNIAKIEIAFGSSSNRLVKMKLVKRMDKWYILSL